ncbi:hypothetical protein Lfu02_77780 [Longispora fulva]|uniref:AcrR family transcriptional regulator n=1 Tax=Longispora fulva TaxID=619741 RepID=A0A8J7KPF0_9ACTN|nr:TetR/AcrR family transcriptional regulator [Longispora fulva]MBG6136227.1 AcrR family transcriptional regulator [Longispora fulva]GIG63406.1 hypothetical protein Lfu02_77780 [Longispora fulva]
MKTRAETVEATRRRIVQAAFGLQTERLTPAIALEAVAERAGVSVQTVLRQFGSRVGLFDAAMEYGAEVVTEERRAIPGDVEGATRAIVEHYELRGDGVILLLAQERVEEAICRITERGRKLHRDWVLETFAPSLEKVAPPDKEALIDLLVVATDVYTWKLLRRDRGLSREATELRIMHLLSTLLGTSHKEA